VNYKLIVEYDGSAYSGWQLQANGTSIQGAIEQALSTFLRTPTRISAAGRTDAGVHALGQVVNFNSEQRFTEHRIRRALNALTPRDIAIKQVDRVVDDFDSRRDARSRVYEYRILNRASESPFHLNRAWHVHAPLDVEAMRRAMAHLIGEHDFSSFRAAGCEATHAVRRIHRVSLEPRGELLVFTIEATAYLRHMVRAIVGTLAEVGIGARAADSFAELLRIKDRIQAGQTAPAGGLFLVEVKY
jgi:tRNA pseudouridine38-40 synthase